MSEALTSRPIPQRTAAISPGIRMFPKKDSGRKPQPSSGPPKATLKPPASLTAWCTDGVLMAYGWCTDGVRMVYVATQKPLQCDPKATLKPTSRPHNSRRADQALFGFRISSFFRFSDLGFRISSHPCAIAIFHSRPPSLPSIRPLGISAFFLAFCAYYLQYP